MSCNNNCGCGVRGMNFRPANQAAQDCFLMLKAAHVFTASFNDLQATITIDQIVDSNGILPQQPFTLIAARSRSLPAHVNHLSPVDTAGIAPYVIIPDAPAKTVRAYVAGVSVAMEILLRDALGVDYRAYGYVELRLDIATTLTYEELTDSGIAVAFATIDATSGVFYQNNALGAALCGSIDLIFLCPALLRMKHEGECSFMPPAGEEVTVSAAQPFNRPNQV